MASYRQKEYDLWHFLAGRSKGCLVRKVLQSVFFILAASLSRPAAAEIVEIPLPGLIGDYPSAVSCRLGAFQIPGTVTLVRGASLRLTGTAVVGTKTCGTPTVLPWPIDLMGIMVPQQEAHSWLSSQRMPNVSGPFSWTAPFFSSPEGATWSFLFDGTGDVTLCGQPTGGIVQCTGRDQPSALVTEAVLILDADFAVPALPSSWGQVKVTYR